MKYEWRKLEKELYLPKNQPSDRGANVSIYQFERQRQSNRPELKRLSRFIYDFLFTQDGIKKGAFGNEPFEYTVFSFRRCVDLSDKARRCRQQRRMIYKIMIRQPEPVTETLFQEQLLAVKERGNPNLEKLIFERYEGLLTASDAYRFF